MSAFVPSQLQPGDIVDGRYHISQAMEIGGATAVYTAKHLLLGRNVRLELLCRDATKDASRRFKRAARVLSMMRHPHIAAIHDMGSYEGVFYTALEYLDGQTLEERSKLLGPFDLQSVRRIAQQLLSAVSYVHGRKILHRDITPSNIVVVKTWNKEEILKLGAFAFAKDLAASRTTTLSDPRTMLPALRHLAPEQIADPNSTDHRVDLYGVGSVLYQLVSGGPAFSGNTLAELGASIMDELPRTLTRHVEHVPQRLDAAILQAMAKDPAHRFESADAMWRALNAGFSDAPPR